MKYLISVIALAAIVVAQEVPKTVVFSFSTMGIDEASGKSATLIFRSEIANTGKFNVIDVDIIKNIIGNDDPVEGITSACDKAKALEASKAIIGSLSKLGEQTLIDVKLIDVNSGIVEFSDRMGSVTGTDFDVILTRLAKGVAERKKSQVTAEVGIITKKEGEVPGRRASFVTSSTRIGSLLPISGFGDDAGVPIGLVGTVNYETEKFMAEMAYSYYGLSEGAKLGAFNISGFKLMSKTDVCPYIGGGFGIGAASTRDFSGGTGPILNLGGGIIFLRTYDFRIITDLRYYISFCEIKGIHYGSYPYYNYYYYDVSKTQHSLSLSVGLMYRGKRSCIFF